MRRGAVVLVFLVTMVGGSAGAWQWPIEGPFRITGEADFSFRFPLEDPEKFRLVAEGEAIFVQSAPEEGTGPARTLPREVYSHGNGIWSIVERDPDTSSVVYRLYDAKLDRFVNPRVLLPLEHEGPFEVLPDLAYRQLGVLRPESELIPGELEIVSPPGGWNSATIPLEISVLHEGRVVATHRFVYAEDIETLLEADGTLRIAAIELRAGANTIEIQTRRYDGTPRLRRYDLIARASSSNGP